MKECLRCGAELGDTTTICSKCGYDNPLTLGRVKAVAICQKCKTFSVPAPMDPVGRALMTEHLKDCQG